MPILSSLLREPFRHRAWLALALIVTALVYLPGLKGPFLFDDPPNIVDPIGAWLRGEIGWQEIVFGNASGMFGRSLSMLTFLGNAAVDGLDPYSYKIINLLIHLGCGVLVYVLTTLLLRRDPLTSAYAATLAVAVASIWLLHPLQVSTVLYVVQRMAQLSTLFVLVALLMFVRGRIAIEKGQKRSAVLHLFFLIPTFTVAAVLSKENGALVPLLCAVIELGYFHPGPMNRRPALVKAFFLLFLLIPILAATGWYASHPEKILDGYAGRTFTFGERLLSEPRALVDYMGIMLAPRGPSLGLYTDDFTSSQGLFSPPSTIGAIIILGLLVAISLAARTRLPMIFTGIGIFLMAHVMESSVFALELYFEHRNYLPSVGFFLAVVGSLFALSRWATSRVAESGRIRALLASSGVALLAVLAIATFTRAGIWSSFEVLATQGAAQHPGSMRAQMDYANVLQKRGEYEKVQSVFDHVATIDNPAAAHVAAIDTVALDCMVRHETSVQNVARMFDIAGGHLQAFEMLAFQNLANYLERNECGNLGKIELAAVIVTVVDAAPQPATLVQIWRSRFIAAKLLVQAGMPKPAEEQLALAWATGAADPAVGAFLATVFAINKDVASSRATIKQVRARLARWDSRGAKLVSELEGQLDALEGSDRARSEASGGSSVPPDA